MSEHPNEPATAAHAGDNEIVKTKKRKHRQWGGATFGLLVGVGGLVAGRLGQLYPAFDVFAQFGMQFMAIAVAFIFAVFFPRFKAMIGSTTTVAFLILYGAWPHLASSSGIDKSASLRAGEKQFRVAHFNTYKNNADYALIADEILRLDADVVSLVEMNSRKKAVVLPALRILYPHIYDCSEPACDVAIASKHPIVASEGRGIWPGAPYARVTLGGEMAGVTFVAVHTIRFPHSRAQLVQVRQLARMLESVSGDLVIAGDFNATPFSKLITVLEQGANVSLLTELPTWPTHLNLPQLAIDHVFASNNFRIMQGGQIGRAVGSDHYPVVITLALKSTP